MERWKTAVNETTQTEGSRRILKTDDSPPTPSHAILTGIPVSTDFMFRYCVFVIIFKAQQLCVDHSHHQRILWIQVEYAIYHFSHNYHWTFWQFNIIIIIYCEITFSLHATHIHTHTHILIHTPCIYLQRRVYCTCAHSYIQILSCIFVNFEYDFVLFDAYNVRRYKLIVKKSTEIIKHITNFLHTFSGTRFKYPIIIITRPSNKNNRTKQSSENDKRKTVKRNKTKWKEKSRKK